MMVPNPAGGALAARYELSTNVTTTPTGMIVPWDTVVFDDLNVTGHNAHEFTLQADGLYLVECEIECGNQPNTEPFATIERNGNDIAFDQKVYDLGGLVGTAAYFHLSTGVNKYHTGDRFKIFLESQDSSAVIDGPAEYNNFTIIKFG